ncbi:pyrimidine dimer DNA glycosylase/endonuclease V [Ewingella americana]|uniref:Uncharacterized protein n=1 Tax=Ewingella americana TaxID=41202 RepID=A0A502GEX6_9GAMM|nr:pyrimidine dimer DNA glycosylase/endonuclease V [Ewingella americana]TPG60088.1 hypothetical protein EAH77_16095 [Ewingella americana]
MRVWFVPIEELSDAHVLGQHRELHMLESMFLHPRFQTHPLVLFFIDKQEFIKDLHDRLVDELFYRFGKTTPNLHKTEYRIIGSDPVPWVALPTLVWFDMYDLKIRYDLAPWKFRWTKREMPSYITNNHVSFDIGSDLPPAYLNAE